MAELKKTRSQRAALRWDEALLLRAKDVERVYERWIQVQAEKADLPKREAELAVAEASLRDLGEQIGWTGESVPGLLARIPPRPKLAEARARQKQRAGLLAEIKTTRAALEEAKTRATDTERRLKEADTTVDASSLAAVIAATQRDFADVGSRILSAESDLAEAEATVISLFSNLRPRPESAAIADTLPAPSRERVLAHRDARLELNRQIEGCAERVRSTENDLARIEKARDRIRTEERPVSREQVIELRETRDSGWALIRRKYIVAEEVPEAEASAFSASHGSLAAAFESAVADADRAADRSFETAESAARLRERDRSIAAERDRLGALREELRQLSERSRTMDDVWSKLWSEAPFDPLDPDAMLSWLDSRTSLRQAQSKRDAINQRLSTLRRQEANACEALVAELEALGSPAASVRAKGLLVLLELAAGELQVRRDAKTARNQLVEGSRMAAAEADAKQKDADRAESAEREWQREWANVVSSLGLARDSTPESVEAQADIIDEMRLVQAEITNLRDKRIRLIRRDIADFESDLGKVVSGIAQGLVGKDSADAVNELRQLLERSRDARKDARAKDRDIAALEAKLRSHEEGRRTAKEKIIALKAAAGVETVEGLKLEIQKAERAERCRSDLEEAVRKLLRDGDGLSLEELEEECLGVNLDEAASREEALREEIAEIREEQLQARDSLREAEGRFKAVGGSDAAALAEGARQNALAEIGEIAGQYIRARSAALLLQWAIERNRREKQAPMLKRAGMLFSELTLGSFEALELDFDERDRARLVGRRPSAERVDVDGMSSGSADQLYLALRIAALEDYIDGADPLPFVADDLFINFDDKRAAAGLRVLQRLAQRCQVIFFTHHEHLLEVAKEAIPRSPHVWRMTS